MTTFASLDSVGRKQATEDQASRAIKRARIRLVQGSDAKSTWFATLALKLQAKPDWGVDTLATDGKTLLYSPEFVSKLDPDTLLGCVCHEVCHNAAFHHTRRGHRDAMRWNVACDAAINPIIISAGFRLPPGALMPGKGPLASLQPGLSAERYYDLLPEDQGGGGQGNDPGGCGEVRDAGDQSQCKDADAQAQVDVAQATAVAKQKGKLPAGLDRMVNDIIEPKVPWQQKLREFTSRTLDAREDFSWSHPNRRFISQDMYLPSLRSESLGEGVIAIDTSGSITQATLDVFAGELNSVLECKPCKITVLYCDCVIQKVVEWQPSDGPLTLEAIGGGGTSHRPIFDWIEENANPDFVICLTDLFTDFPTRKPSVPVLWAVEGNDRPHAPFGQIITIE